MKKSAKDNKSLSNFIREQLDVERFGKPFSELIVETFVRMQYVLNLSPDEIEEDIINFANTIHKFSFDKLEDKNALGETRPYDKEIVFNIEYYQNLMNEVSPEEFTISFFETFVHESLHGMQEKYDEDGRLENRAGGYNERVDNRVHAIYEICTQGIAAKCARDRSYKDFRNGKILTGDGYSHEIFAVPLISSTFGITEQEFLKYGVRERSKLIEALNKNIGNYEYTEKILNKIEDELEMMHSLYFPDDNQVDFKNLTKNERMFKESDAILKLVDLCQEVFSKRIKNIPLDIENKEITELKFDQKKMLDTLKYEFFGYKDYFDNDSELMYYIATENSENAKYIKKSLNLLSDIAKDESGTFSNVRIPVVNEIKNDSFEELTRVGIKVERDVTRYLFLHDIGMQDEKIYIDYNGLIEWDNSYIKNIIYNKTIKLEREEESLNLKNWNEERMNGFEGINKYYTLENAIKTTSKFNNGKDVRYELFKFLRADETEYSEIYSNIRAENGAREGFQREFCNDNDKEYLAKIFAQKYIDKIYDFDKNIPKEISCKNSVEEQIKNSILPTIQKYGKEQAMWAISKSILEGSYDAISGEKSREKLSLISPDAFLNVVSAPLMNEMLKKREISKNLKEAVGYSMFKTEQKYDSTIDIRLSRFIEDYKKNGELNFSYFTADGRDELMKNVKTQSDVESMIGVICNDFCLKSESEKRCLSEKSFYEKLAVKMGNDSFREAIINGILYNDYSLFPSGFSEVLEKTDNEEIFKQIISPTLLKVESILDCEKENKEKYVAPVKVADLKENAKSQKLSVINMGLDKLKNFFKINIKEDVGFER